MHLSRSGWALTGLSAAAVGLLAPGTPQLARELGGPSFPDALVAGASLIVLGLAAWSLLGASAVLLGGSSRLVAAITPSLLRQALIAGAAGALAVGPAHAGQSTAPDTTRHTVDGLRLPDRPDTTETTVTNPASEATSAAVVEVHRGDTLWAIAARALPDDATPHDIAVAAQRWHAANRDVIGDDPDRIFPTQRLTPPTGKDHP